MQEKVMDEFEKWLEDELGNNVYENIYRTHLLRVRAKYRAHKAKAVEAKAEGLMEELESCLSGDNDYFMHLNGEAMKNRAFIPKKMIAEVVSRYRHASPAVEELVRELREWSIGCHSQDDDGRAERCPGLSKFDQILAKYDKGGK